VSYLDLARQYATGDWSAIRNGYWSPLYPMLIGVALWAVQWSGLREITVVYSVNLILLLLATRAFAWLLDELAMISSGETLAPTQRRFGDGWSRGAAWALFAWLMVRLTGIATLTPDILVAAQLFAATAVLARRVRGPLPRRYVLAFGALLGTAYMAKTVMFPVAFVLLAAYAWGARARRGPDGVAREALVAFATFAAISLPLVIAQSRAAGRLSIGETGRLNYAWYVNYASPTIGGFSDSAGPRGAAVALTSIEGAHLFVDSAAGSFPYWYDPARWSAGVRARPDVAEQMQVLRVTGRWYRQVVGLPVVGVLLLFVLALEAKRRPRLELWPLLVAPATLLALYALIHVEGRLIGAALITALTSMLAIADADDLKRQSRSREMVLAGIIAFGLVGCVQALIRGPRLPEIRDASRAAAQIRRAGVGQGADVAVVGSPLDQGDYWAHLAEVQIVATIPAEGALKTTAAVLDSLVVEGCAAGRNIRAVVWRDSTLWRDADVRGVAAREDGSWFVWLPRRVRSECRA
jgi:hypothetical protein